MKAWCNETIIDEAAPAVSLFDHGFTVGDGVFETLKLVSGRPFALTRHLARLQRSAEGLGLAPPDADVIRAGVAEVLAANDGALGPLGRMRITVTSGPGPAGSERGPGPATIAITVGNASPWPATTSVVLAPWPRNERSAVAGLKTTSYGENAAALAWAKARGFSEALLGNTAGELCEGTGSNVFVVVAGRLLTPPLSSGCLAGITRELVVQWCGAREEPLPLAVLEEAEEVFITSSTRDVHPVDRVGGRQLIPGPVTGRVVAEFSARSRQIDP